MTVALPVPTPIQEIEEESTEKEEVRETQVEIVEGQENSSETRESAKALNKAKSSAPSAFENSHSITDLFSRVQRAFFYMTGIDSRTLFDRCSYFNQTLFRGMYLWFGAFGVSAAAYFLFFNRGAALGSFVSKVNVLPVVSAGGQAVATSVASVVSAGVQAVATSLAPAVSSGSSHLSAIFALASSTELKAQYDAVHKLLRHYLKDRGHTLSWCYKHGKITLELFWYIVLNGLMKKHWHQSFEIPK
ncbi:putative membrane protein [Criblamydia sequanensis CRIB-18]|uniref:Membrane protein n=1 Tax=Candidatus Criblamydia sequanensis CRIB-18 TaxID=1437425 RepID=A0A090D1I3_9BACT|nr:putative membrane protein [Criblamydia sequanensis CRIB-18]